MKKFILGFISALVLVGLIYFAYPFIRSFFSGASPVSPESLNPSVKDYGSLRVEIFGKGNPLADVEVDLGKIGSSGPTGPMSFLITDSSGLVVFKNVPVGSYNIFFNDYHFPNGYVMPRYFLVNITKDQNTQERIDLAPKQ
jgi:hypothetical protein